MKQIAFFAVHDDLAAMIGKVESECDLQYVRTGNFMSLPPHPLESALSWPELGVADKGTASICASFLVSERGREINPRYLDAAEKRRVLIDQLLNPDTVVFTPAGKWKDILLHGRVSTVSDTSGSQKLMGIFSRAIRAQFKKVRAFYVGPTALSLFKSGTRLTISDQSPQEFDLKEEGSSDIPRSGG